MIIGITGEKLAGKGTAANYLQRNYQAEIFKLSGILSSILERLYLENSRSNLVRLGESLRKGFGDDILGKTLIKDLEDSKANIKIIDGIRYVSEYTLFSSLPNFQLIYITAPVEIRYQRMKNRVEKSDEQNMTQEEFLQREQDSTEQEIQQLKPLANNTINNDQDFAQFYKYLEHVLA